jgi:flagellar assembly protein FliH
MATSSDWLAALAAPPPTAPAAAGAPRWFEALGHPRGFDGGVPFGRRPALGEAPAVPADPQPVPAAPDACLPDTLAAAEARAFAQGEAAGRAAASAEAAREAGYARALRLNFRALDEAALGVLADELAATVTGLCAAVLGDYATDGAALAARCEAAAARLGAGWAGAVLHLHPDDLANLPAGALAGWPITSDPALERGALVIEGPDGAVRDTPADWRRALAEAVRP